MLRTQQEDTLDISNPYNMFKYSTRSELTRKYYERRLKKFFDFINFENKSDIETRCNNFAKDARNVADGLWAVNLVIDFLQSQKNRVEKKEITASTLRNFVKALKLFCEMADRAIPWKRITRGLPRAKMVANDRAPTLQEIQKLVEYPDRRIKSIVYTMSSSGIRLGAWDYLKWKHIIPLSNDNGEIVAAKIIVYAGDSEEYYSFLSPEAYHCLKEWIDFRESYGEIVSGNSWLMRDLWQTTNIKYGARWGLAKFPRKLKSNGVKRIIERALWEQGLRQPLGEGEKRHEWKAAHGFRKFFKTRSEQVMKPINVEITMGHDIGISGCYYKPTEKEVLEDYLKAIDLLTINNTRVPLEKQIAELTEKGKNKEFIIQTELLEKEKEIQALKKRDILNTESIAGMSEVILNMKKDIEILKKRSD